MTAAFPLAYRGLVEALGAWTDGDIGPVRALAARLEAIPEPLRALLEALGRAIHDDPGMVIPDAPAAVRRISGRDDLGDILTEAVQEALNPPPASGPVRDDRIAPFPTEVYPGPVRRLVEIGAEALGCPPDYLGAPVLAVAGAALGNAREIEVRERWREGPRFYIALVALPGSAKSAAISAVARPLFEIQREARHKWTEAKAWYDDEFRQYEARAKSRRSGPTERPPEEPRLARTIAGDATIEALSRLLAENSRGLLLLQDELAGWVRSMDAYKGGGGADRAKFLSAWSGEAWAVDRRGEKHPILIDRPLINVVGCIPPDLLGELADRERRADGFLDRILYAYPAPAAPPMWRDSGIPEDVAIAWEQSIRWLRRLQPKAEEGGEMIPEVSYFTVAGRAEFAALHNRMGLEMAAPAFPMPLRGAWAKLRGGTAARIALVLQFLRLAAGETEEANIEPEAVRGAGALVAYFGAHARRAFAFLSSDEDDRKAEAAVKWLRDRGGEAPLREMVRCGVAGLKKTSEGFDLLKDLIDRGLAIREDRPPDNRPDHRGGKPTIVVRLAGEEGRMSGEERANVGPNVG